MIRTNRYRKIIKTVEIKNNDKILDLSCSDGLFLKQLSAIAPGLQLFGVDVDSAAIEKARKDCPSIIFNTENAENLNFQDDTFDSVFSMMSLHHYENSQKIFNEIKRVLKKSGTFFLADLVPKYKWTQKTWNYYGCPEPYHFEKYYSISDIETLLKPLNCSIVADKKVSSLPRLRILTINKQG